MVLSVLRPLTIPPQARTQALYPPVHFANEVDRVQYNSGTDLYPEFLKFIYDRLLQPEWKLLTYTENVQNHSGFFQWGSPQQFIASSYHPSPKDENKIILKTLDGKETAPLPKKYFTNLENPPTLSGAKAFGLLCHAQKEKERAQAAQELIQDLQKRQQEANPDVQTLIKVGEQQLAASRRQRIENDHSVLARVLKAIAASKIAKRLEVLADYRLGPQKPELTTTEIPPNPALLTGKTSFHWIALNDLLDTLNPDQHILLSGILDELHKTGWIKRKGDSVSNRRYQLTEKGYDLYNQYEVELKKAV